jgi:RNA polymerase sigma factor FliA
VRDVTLIARRIHERSAASATLDDLISAGIVGLIAAIDRYDPCHQVSFKSYAEFKIRGAILDSLRETKADSPSHQKRAKLIETAISIVEQEKNHIATDEEIAGQLHLSLEKYQEWLYDLRGLTLGKVEAVGPGSDLYDLLVYQIDSDPASELRVVDKVDFERLLAQFIVKMPKAERTVLSRYYHEELTLAEIANVLHLPESRIAQLRAQAIIRLRSYLSRRVRRTAGIVTQGYAPQLRGFPKDAHSLEASEKDESALSIGTRREGPTSYGLSESNSGEHVRSLIEDPIVGILMAAAAAFQTLEVGKSWLLTPNPALGKITPISLISTEEGRDIVANELGLIAHGMF